MIDINDWPTSAKIILVLGPFVIGLPGPAILAFLVLRKDYDVACSAIQSNPYLESMKQAWGGRPFKWRWMLMCMVAGLITFPGLALHRGKLDPDELKRFPPKLKFKLALAAWLTVLGCIWMIVAYTLVELSEGR
ncbi:hypothetical protein [Pseudomonas putida]|uniref:hypothetical protein n=1 Tax=Pseudomonas putida TaxID=303 RepID=UPI0024E07CF7|nr:hypothetical protein [Pseudomonas putida]HDS0964957.1 hypothetical protein [Pseudomonas putida]